MDISPSKVDALVERYPQVCCEPEVRSEEFIVVKPAILFFILSICNISLAFIYIVTLTMPVSAYKEALFILFDLNGEANFPAWYSSIQLFATSVALFFCSFPARYKGYLPHRYALGGSIVLLYLSADENVGLHEKFTGLTNHLKIEALLIFDMGSWIYFYLIIGIFLMLLSWNCLFLLWKYYRTVFFNFALGTIIFISGAILVEVLGYYLIASDSPTYMRQAAVTIEEFLEMMGVSIFLTTTIHLYNMIKNHSSVDN